MRISVSSKYIILRERPHKLAPVYWNSISQTSSGAKKIHGVTFGLMWGWHHDGRQMQFYKKNEWDRLAKFLARRLSYDKKYFRLVRISLARSEIKVSRFLKNIRRRILTELSLEQLIELANLIKRHWIDYDQINVFPWYLGGDNFQIIIKNRLNISEEDFLFLSTPLKKTFATKLEEDLLKYARLIKSKHTKLDLLAQKLSVDYGWLPFGYNGPVYWDVKYFSRKLKHLVGKYNSQKIEEKLAAIKRNDRILRSKYKQLIKKYKLNKKQLIALDQISTLAIWTDERKRWQYELHYHYDKILSVLAKKFGVSDINLQYLFTEELAEIDKNPQLILRKTNERIKHGFVIEFSKGQGGVLNEEAGNKIIRELKKIEKTKILKGVVASRGQRNIYKARVKIILSPQDFYKIKSGEFLVTTMTSPDYILAMKKALGFITDEGGVTCHAAIVAREMNKPCIIGTRVATKILHDGDMVEIDTKKGTVKKI